MGNIVKNKLLVLFALVMAMTLYTTAHAEKDETRKMVIQVSTDDPRTQKIALNNASNLQQAIGVDDITIEIVAYGPGLGIMTTKNELASRVKSMAVQGIKFSACNNTIKKVTKKKGKAPELVEGVQVVPAGVVRILELQEQGYAYLRP